MSKREHQGSAGVAWRRCGLLVLVALAWTQLSLAAHQFDHPASAADYTCSICLQLDRTGDGIVAVSASADAPDAAAGRPAGPPPRPADRDPLTARQRGPPPS